MARTKIVLFKSNIRRDGSCPVCLRVAKEDKTKYIDLQLSATKGQWDELASRFKKDKRVNPNYENYNALLNRYEVRKDEILQKFMEERVNWTLNQFEEEFLGMSKQGKVYDYFMRQVENLKATRHIGNAKVYERTLHMLAKYDDKIEERLFSELDVYKHMFEDLDYAIQMLGEFVDEVGGLKPLEGYDPVYNGDYNKWMRFANSLKLRLAVRISNVSPELARTKAEEAGAKTNRTSLKSR